MYICFSMYIWYYIVVTCIDDLLYRNKSNQIKHSQVGVDTKYLDRTFIFIDVNSEGSGKTALVRRLARAFTDHL